MKYRSVLVSKFDVQVIYQDFHLDTFYELIGCNIVDIPCRRIGGVFFDIWVDDEGLLKSDCFVSGVNSRNEAMLVNNLVITNHDIYGDPRSLTDEEVELIMSNVITDEETGRKAVRMECK